MIIKINEKQLRSFILEKSGYVTGLDDLINYVYKTYSNYIKNNYINKIGDGKAVNDYFKSNYDDYDIISNLKFDKHTLLQYNIDFVDNIDFKLFFLEMYDEQGNLNNNSANGFFDTNSINTINDRVISFSILLNVMGFIWLDEPTMISTIQHELTHAYERCQFFYKNGRDKTEAMDSNYYDFSEMDENGINISNIIYTLNKSELNATISETYAFLKSKQANLSNYKDVLEQSPIHDKLMALNVVKKAFIKNYSGIVDKIYQFNQQNNKYADIFPSSNKKTIRRYQKRLISMVEDKIKYLIVKQNRLIKQYLNDNG